MKTIRIVICLSIAMTTTILSFAQDASEDLRINRSVLSYYNGNTINDLSDLEPVKYDLLRKYFVQSFFVSSKDCASCPIDYDEFFNREMFNIVNFESSRAQSEQVGFVFNERYKITLISLDEVDLLLNGNTPDDMLSLRAVRPLPSFIETGNVELDYTKYKEQLTKWIADFPSEYRAITAGNDLLRVTIGTFKECSTARKESILSSVNGYLITD